MRYDMILASGSPRRKEILEQIGAKFRVLVSDCDETIGVMPPEQAVLTLSERKADAVAEEVTGPAVILGADTVVSAEGRILGKPKDREEALEMLELLSGRVHEVYTGVCLVRKEADGSTRRLRFAKCSRVKVRTMTPEQSREYAGTKEPYDKAGGYAIQGSFAPYIEGIEGDYYTIVGLPVSEIFWRLWEDGIDLRSGEVLPLKKTN